MAYLLEMRELGESRWIPLADQQLSPVHGSIEDGEDHRVPVTTTMDHFIGMMVAQYFGHLGKQPDGTGLKNGVC